MGKRNVIFGTNTEGSRTIVLTRTSKLCCSPLVVNRYVSIAPTMVAKRTTKTTRTLEYETHLFSWNVNDPLFPAFAPGAGSVNRLLVVDEFDESFIFSPFIEALLLREESSVMIVPFLVLGNL